MEVRRLSCAEGSRDARGVAVVIDVFRAFTCEPLLYAMGAAEVVLEGDVERCLRLKGDAVLVGEVNEQPISGFDFTNSPTHIAAAGPVAFAGRRVIHRSTAGVTGALAALDRCDEVLLGAFVTARATARYILAHSPTLVSLVAMGMRGKEPAPEDECCADYIESLLTDRAYDHLAALNTILHQSTAMRFLRGDKPYLPPQDPVYCLQRDLFPFALKAERCKDWVVARQVAVAVVAPEPFRQRDERRFL
jgi:2-phosphosulfolactate phosphatase